LIGSIVYSKCGHDKGQIFVIVDEDDFYYYLANGKQRLVSNPKKKKHKHVQLTNYICKDIEDLIMNKMCLDSNIKKAIKKYEERE